MGQSGMIQDELYEAIGKLLDGQIDRAELERLETELLQSECARALYREMADIHASLAWPRRWPLPMDAVLEPVAPTAPVDRVFGPLAASVPTADLPVADGNTCRPAPADRAAWGAAVGKSLSRSGSEPAKDGNGAQAAPAPRPPLPGRTAPPPPVWPAYVPLGAAPVTPPIGSTTACGSGRL